MQAAAYLAARFDHSIRSSDISIVACGIAKPMHGRL
jgi:hypothetical protein